MKDKEDESKGIFNTFYTFNKSLEPYTLTN